MADLLSLSARLVLLSIILQQKSAALLLLKDAAHALSRS
jgi:hypothetical protein